jgi:hypothetical protein
MRPTRPTPWRFSVPWRFSKTAASVALLATLACPPAACAGGVEVSGLLDLVAAGRSEAAGLNLMYRGVSPLDGYQLHVFLNGTVNDRLRVYTQLQFAEASGGRPIGAYAMANPWEGKDLHLVAGLIPWLIGTYEPQSYSDKNPLVGIPMLYQYHTSLRWDQIPANADQLLGKAGQGYAGVTYSAGARSLPGLPVVYSDWWDFGIGFLGSLRPVELSLGMVNGTPSYPSPARDDNKGKTVLGRIGIAPAPGARFGISGAYGPYLVDGVQGALPPGRSAEDYHQVLAMTDAEWAVAHLSLRAEGFRNTWETPSVGDLRVKGFYAEGKYNLPAGFYVAGRYEILRFSDLADSTGGVRPWDSDQTRIEAGVGYRIARTAVAKAVFQRNLTKEDEDEAAEPYDLVAAQLSLRF